MFDALGFPLSKRESRKILLAPPAYVRQLGNVRRAVMLGGGKKAPTGLTATPGVASIALSWTPSAGATSYNVYRGTSPGGESTTPLTTGVVGTTYTDSTYTAGQIYYYTVAAVGSGGTSSPSNEASGTAGARNLGGLQAYYAFESLLADSTGGTSLTNTDGTVLQGTGIIGYGAAFTSSTQNLGRGSFGLTPTFSLSFWVNFASLNTFRGITGDTPPARSRGWYLFVSNSDSSILTMEFGNNSSTGSLPSGTISGFGSWFHCLVVYTGNGVSGNASRLRWWVNGSPMTLTFSGLVPATLTYTQSPVFSLGLGPITNPLFGVIDEYAIGNQDWSSLVGSLYNNDLGVTY